MHGGTGSDGSGMSYFNTVLRESLSEKITLELKLE